MRDWIGGIAAWLSQGINCALLRGNPDMTVSARCYVYRDDAYWRMAYTVINWIVFWQKDHCRASFQSDVIYATWVMAILDESPE